MVKLVEKSKPEYRGRGNFTRSYGKTSIWLVNRGPGIFNQYIPTRTPFYWHGLTLIPACISNYIHYKVWDEITYPFLTFNGCTVEV